MTGLPRLLHVVGARPNLPKLAPVYTAARKAGLEQFVVHSGQHYSAALTTDIHAELELPEPDVNLAVGSASHAVQTARIMERLEPVVTRVRPDWVVVYGDVNSTVAAALVASKLGVPVAHVEAGLRSGDRGMPEEINRIVTDRLADLLLTPSRDAGDVLRAEGEPDDEIMFVGNVMIDTLFKRLPRARETGFSKSLGMNNDPVVVTLHRPSNVDDFDRLSTISLMLRTIAERHPVVFPMHPRTEARFAEWRIELGDVRVLPPVSYLEMVDLVQGSRVVITDSGGLQEETTALAVPCLTLRENTERPVTITEGTNQLVRDLSTLPELVRGATRVTDRTPPEGWDGRAGERVVHALIQRARPRSDIH